jgi:NAD+--dinitrogen-reductase ADP-D-ribosyltransferase
MNTYKTNVDIFDRKLSLPEHVFLPLNRCNIPAPVLGSRQFQHHAKAIHIDGVDELYPDLFKKLAVGESAQTRAQLFMDYMDMHFRLFQLEDAGWNKGNPHHRIKADYRRLLRGWLFDTNGREGAILKAWVESRFGLTTRYHAGPLTDPCYYQAYNHARSQGLYGTNALESQLDLLYSYCQYELSLSHHSQQHSAQESLQLFRGVHNLGEYEVLQQSNNTQAVILLNNLNSFSSDVERADEFGDQVITTQVPKEKILFYSNLLPGLLCGENEFLVIGGVYDISVVQR